MTTFRCPELDRLGRELIEAYRNAEDYDIFCISAGLDIPNQIEAVHLAMAEHRRVCLVCFQIERSEEASRLLALKENTPPMS